MKLFMIRTKGRWWTSKYVVDMLWAKSDLDAYWQVFEMGYDPTNYDIVEVVAPAHQVVKPPTSVSVCLS